MTRMFGQFHIYSENKVSLKARFQVQTDFSLCQCDGRSEFTDHIYKVLIENYICPLLNSCAWRDCFPSVHTIPMKCRMVFKIIFHFIIIVQILKSNTLEIAVFAHG